MEEPPQYFPPLERCLKRDHLLLSWQEAYSALCFPQNAASPGIQKFFADSATQNVLKKPFAPFEPQQNSQFATITAAINVTPNDNGPYDIKQIKGDALWLAEAINIDKVAALRMVVLEWQKRPAVQMLSRPVDEEDSQAPDVLLDISIFAPKSSIADAPKNPGEQNANSFDSAYSRQLRLLRLAISEASYVLAISELRIRQFAISKAAAKEQAAAAVENAPSGQKGKSKEHTPIAPSDGLGQALLDAACPGGDGSKTITDSVEAMRKVLDLVGMNGEHPANKNKTLEKFWGDLETLWFRTHFMRFVGYLKYIFTVADSSSKIPTAEAVLSYFEFMHQEDFFARLGDLSVSGIADIGRNLQNVIQLASLAVLRLDASLEPMDRAMVNLYPDLTQALPRSDYLQDASCIKKLHDIFKDMAAKEVATAALSMLAWSCIYITLREAAESSRRDSTDSINTEPEQPSSQQKRREAFSQALQQIQQEPGNSEGENSTFELIGTTAVVDLQVFAQLTAIASSVRSDFGAGINDSFAIRCRHTLLTLITAGAPLVMYGEQTLGALLSVIGGDRPYWELADREPGLYDNVTQTFIDDFGMVQRFLGESLGRYPEESTPFYRILRTLFLNGKLTVESFTKMFQYLGGAETFTRRLPQDFNAYDEAPDMVTGLDDVLAQRLFTDLPYFVSRKTGLYSQRLAITNGNSQTRSSHVGNCVPKDSVGIPADESRKPIVMTWQHHFNPLDYLTGCLHTVLAGNDWVDASTGREVPLEDISEIISLLSVVVMATRKVGGKTAQESAAAILDRSFAAADSEKTLLAIVAEIFECQLQEQQAKPGDAISLDLLVQCVRFFHAVAICVPGRIWPILSRSNLLELDGNGGSLAAIVTSVEMITGQYDFLIGCIRLFDALVDASLRPGGNDSQGPNKPLTRLNSRAASQTGGDSLPQRMATTIITSFSRTLVSVFRNSRSWRYNSPSDRSEISTRLSQTFDRILHYTFGFDDEVDLHKKAVTSILADSSIYLAETLLSTSPSHQLSETLIDMMVDGFVSISSQQFFEAELWPVRQVEAALELCTTSLRVGMSRDASSSCLEQALLKAAPALARLYTIHEGTKSTVATLLGVLVTITARNQSEPASLLGYMGPSTAQDFLSVVGDFAHPIDSAATEIEIWKMLSAVVSSRQQRFAIALLTDDSRIRRPQKTAGEKSKKSRVKPVLTHALNELSSITTISTLPETLQLIARKRALAMLEFVALCQNHWAWAVTEIRTHPTFISSITGYVRALKREDGETPTQACEETAMAASIAEVLAMYLHASAQVGDAAAVKNVLPHLQYYNKYGVMTPKYNSSLHGHLKTNLSRHGGLQPGNFKHTDVFPTNFGENYFYDVVFETKVFRMRQPANEEAVQDMRTEFERANIDLSALEAQIKLLKQWKLLVTQLSKTAIVNNGLTGLLLAVAKQCLEENAQKNVPEKIFERLRHHRIDLIMVLLQKLVSLDIPEGENSVALQKLFPNAWHTIRESVEDHNFDSTFSGSNVENYRPLLKILFLTLQPYRKRTSRAGRPQNKRPDAPPQSQGLLEVVLHVIIKGFRNLSSILHEDPSACQPNDFVLLTALLQSILDIPGIELLHSHLALQFANNNISGYATSLFSWCDQLVLDGDPIFGELAILFLLEMSSVPLIAESMAVDGVLSQLTSAKIMQLYARPRGMGPFDSPTRLHSIWTRGILPLCLNLLDAVGAPLAAEVVSFLNHFPNQLARLATDLANRSSPIGTKPSDSHITLSIASETHSLALISLVINRYAAAGASTGTLMQDIPALKWDKVGIKEDVDDWVGGRSSLGVFVLPANEREAGLSQRGALEERVWAELGAASECLGAEGA